MKLFKKIISAIMVAVMLITAAPLDGLVGLEIDWSEFGFEASAADELATMGQCGDDVWWMYSKDTGSLVIAGQGDMWNYEYDSTPFREKYILEIEIDNGVTSIGDRAFYFCYILTSVKIPDSVISIGDDAFSYCDSLTSVEIPDSVTSIGDYAFSNCSSLTSIEIPDSVTSIGDYAFSWCERLTSIEIPDSITSMGDYAFAWCQRLTSIEIPDSVTSIGSYAFYNTAYYNDTDNWEDGVLYIGNHLIEVTDDKSGNYAIKSGTRTIADVAFSNCSSLTSIEIPDSVTSIGGIAFCYCASLTSIEIPDSVTSIGGSAFSYCASLTSIEIPDSVTSIGDGVFSWCSSLTSIEIPDSVTSIGDYAFGGCSSLTSIEIPDSITSIGDDAFSGCSSLTSITVDKNNAYYSSDNFGVLFNKKKSVLIQYPIGNGRTEYNIPDSVTSIGDFAFSRCDSLISVEIPDSVTNIGYGAFYSCHSLTSIEIPDSVTSIGSYAFYSCDSLTDVYYGGSEAEWNEISIGWDNIRLTGANIHFNSSMPGEDEGYKIYTLHTFASQPRLVFGYGDAMSMAFELECFEENGRYYLVEDVNFTLTSSDTDIFYIEDIDKDGETTTARIVSENPGTAILTVGAYVDGEYITSSQFYITVEGERVYHMDSLSDPDMNTSDCKIISNNFAAENFKCDEYEETCAVTFDIYNRLNCLGAVEVYDSKGSLVETKSVSEYGGLLPTGLWDATKMMFDFTSLKENSYKDETYSKKTSISLSEVPKDGYIKITFDSAESEVVAFYNASSLIVDAVLELLTLETSDEVKEEVIKTATEEITDKCLQSISADKQLKKYADKILTKYCQSLSVGEVGEIKNALEGVLYLWDTLKVDYKKIIADVLKGMIESAWETVVLKLAGTVGEVVEKLFDAIKTYNMINQAQTLEKMRNSKSSCIYVEKDRKTQLYSNGYYVKQNDSFENSVSFHKYKIVSGDTYYQAMSEFADEEYIDVISMSLFRNGKEVQPNGQVEVAIPLPEGMNIFNIRVYRYEEDTGKFTRLECDVRDIDNGYIYVKTEHFSVYCIVADTTEATEVEIENKNCYIRVDDSLLPAPLFKPFDCIAPEYWLISSNENVAKVTNEGAVIGVGLGCAEITLTTENGLSAVFKVNVVNDCYFNGHISDNGTVIKNSTCSEEGIIEYLCTLCGDSYTEAIPATGHKETTLNAVAATCISTGLTAGKKCTVCGTITAKQQIIAKTAHKEVTVAGTPATYKATGLTEGKKCSVCNTVTVAQKTIEKLTLGKVDGLKAKKVKVAKKSEITLTWNSLGDGVEYEVYIKNGKKWKKLTTTSKTSYTVKKDGKKKSLKADKEYQFRVRAVVDDIKGKYSSTLKVETIPSTATLKLKAGKKQLTASWSKVSDISGYEVQYSTSKKMKSAKTVNAKKSAKKTTIKKLKKGKKYYVRVRAYKTVDGKKIYSDWSKVKNVKIK